MPIYDCGDPECGECQRAFGPDRSKAIANYHRREACYATLEANAKVGTQVNKLEEAMGHLGAAISQSLPSDDQIIMDHVREAHKVIMALWKEQRQEPTDIENAACAKIANDLEDEAPTGSYDNGGTMDGWQMACRAIAKAILNRRTISKAA